MSLHVCPLLVRINSVFITPEEMLSNTERPRKYVDNDSGRDHRSRDDSRDRNRDRRDREQEHSNRKKRSRSRSDSRRRDEGQRRSNNDKYRDESRDQRPLENSRNSSRNNEETQTTGTAAAAITSFKRNEETNHQPVRQRREKKHDDHGQYTWGKQEEIKKTENEEEKKEPEYKPDFGLSGALAKDEKTGNVLNGQVLKFTEPYEAAMPVKKWRLYVYKENDLLDTLYLHRRSCFLIGRDTRVTDIHILHPSSSLQHAVIQFRGIEKKVIVDRERVKKTFIKPYIMDLSSTHGTYLNGEKIENARYYELREKDLLKFGSSTRDYILLHDHSNTEDDDNEES